jgi:hypothetical protein
VTGINFKLIRFPLKTRHKVLRKKPAKYGTLVKQSSFSGFAVRQLCNKIADQFQFAAVCH